MVNYSGDFPFLWDEITVPIRFGSDLDMAQAVVKAETEVCSEYAEKATTIWARMQARSRSKTPAPLRWSPSSSMKTG